MAVTDLKAQFCKQLKKYIKNAGVKQCELASALKMSASAVSQMLSGLIVPNVKQLDIIMEKIALDRVTCAVLRDYLIRIRSGEEDLRSPLNDFIRDSRIKAGLSIEELSEQSGIPVEDLNNLENMLAMVRLRITAARRGITRITAVNDTCAVFGSDGRIMKYADGTQPRLHPKNPLPAKLREIIENIIALP